MTVDTKVYNSLNNINWLVNQNVIVQKEKCKFKLKCQIEQNLMVIQIYDMTVLTQ